MPDHSLVWTGVRYLNLAHIINVEVTETGAKVHWHADHRGGCSSSGYPAHISEAEFDVLRRLLNGWCSKPEADDTHVPSSDDKLGHATMLVLNLQTDLRHVLKNLTMIRDRAGQMDTIYKNLDQAAELLRELNRA